MTPCVIADEEASVFLRHDVAGPLCLLLANIEKRRPYPIPLEYRKDRGSARSLLI